jgi:hypothetical protein
VTGIGPALRSAALDAIPDHAWPINYMHITWLMSSAADSWKLAHYGNLPYKSLSEFPTNFSI